jgi:MoxR-like ATPase
MLNYGSFSVINRYKENRHKEEKMIDIKPGHIEELPAVGSWPTAVHVFEKKTIWAVNAALAAERPLLVRGEPGSGKSQLARAAAKVLHRAFISEVVHSRSECRDLQWHFDAVARLGEAQTLGTTAGPADITARLDPKRFLSPGALWWTFDWESAEKQFNMCNMGMGRPLKPKDWNPEQGCVLLLDEIDKADADLPNGLLETLGNGAFTVPYLDEPIGMEKNAPPPLVVITTNEERELPGAFLRRCLVLHLALPEEEEQLVKWLSDRGEIHFKETCKEKVRAKAAALLWKDRQEALKHGLQPPGQAEYLDMLRAVGRLYHTEEEQLKALDDIAEFALVKHPLEQ